MGLLKTLTRSEIEALGPPVPEDLADTDVPESYLLDLTLRHVASLIEPETAIVADRLQLSRALTEELLYQLYREKAIEMRLQSAVGSTRYAMLDHGWERLKRLQNQSTYMGPAPVSLGDYSHMIRLQATPTRPASMNTMRSVFSDLVLPVPFLQTLGCAINSRSSLFLTGLPGTGKTATAERMNAALLGSIWIPYSIEVDGHIIRIFDSHCHKRISQTLPGLEYDRRWVEIKRPMVIVGGELTLQDTDLTWSEAVRFYEAPLQVKSNGGTLVIDDFGRQRVPPQDLLNRWTLPLERRVDFLTLNNGKKIEIPFEQLVIFSTNLDDKDLVDEAFLRRMGYRARLEPPSRNAYLEIFRRTARDRGITVDAACLDHLMAKYVAERRIMKACEPRDLLKRVVDICLFHGRTPQLTIELMDVAWNNYFGAVYGYDSVQDLPSPSKSLGTDTVS